MAYVEAIEGLPALLVKWLVCWNLIEAGALKDWRNLSDPLSLVKLRRFESLYQPTRCWGPYVTLWGSFRLVESEELPRWGLEISNYSPCLATLGLVKIFAVALASIRVLSSSLNFSKNEMVNCPQLHVLSSAIGEGHRACTPSLLLVSLVIRPVCSVCCSELLSFGQNWGWQWELLRRRNLETFT